MGAELQVTGHQEDRAREIQNVAFYSPSDFNKTTAWEKGGLFQMKRDLRINRFKKSLFKKL